jgi:hypothetical protein
METDKYRNSKMKEMKINSEKELTRRRLKWKKRHFWNEKAEQLCTQAKTASQNKQTLHDD